MANPSLIKLPTKLKKFGITDPFQIILVTKYENEIPWQKQVRNPDTLSQYVKDVMLNDFFDKVAYPPLYNHKNFYITKKNISQDYILNIWKDISNDESHPNDLSDNDYSKVKSILKLHGEESAVKFLVEVINKNKYDGYKNWIDFFTKKYKKYPVFVYLVLRSFFEKNGSGIRRVIEKPSPTVIEWLFIRIKNNRLCPPFDIHKEYYTKLGMGLRFKNGWQMINSPSKLVAIAQNTGWCIATHYYANLYLENGGLFYILIYNNSAVVALRLESERDIIVECQGRYNEPPYNWFSDIRFFIESMNLKLEHRSEIIEKTNNHCENEDINWWNKRIMLWPMAYNFAPETIKKNFDLELIKINAINSNLFSFDDFKEKLNIVLTKENIIELIHSNLDFYFKIPSDVLENNLNEYQEAYKLKYIQKIEDDDLTPEEIRNVPDFVKKNEEFKIAIVKHFPKALDKLLTKSPSSREERTNRFKLDKVLKASVNESLTLAVKRAVNIIIQNDNADFSINLFPEELQKHESFKEIRKKAWINTVELNPTFYFALPTDLKPEYESFFKKYKEPNEKTTEYISYIMNKPWLLTQKNTVPKSVCHQQEILKAYVEGWYKIIYKEPWKMWHETRASSFNPRKRIYLSYAALKEKKIIEAFSDGLSRDPAKIVENWNKASERMKSISAFQFGVILSLAKCKEYMKILREIENLNKNNTSKIQPYTFEYYIREVVATQNIFFLIDKFNSPENYKLFKMSTIFENASL
jgi:hypothetical protein